MFSVIKNCISCVLGINKFTILGRISRKEKGKKVLVVQGNNTVYLK